MTDSQHTERLPEDDQPTNAIALVSGRGGLQQEIAVDPAKPLTVSVTNTSGDIHCSTEERSTILLVVAGETDADEVNLTVNVDGNKVSIHPDWQFGNNLSGLARKIKDQLKNGFDTNDFNFSKIRFGSTFDGDLRIVLPRNLAAGTRVSLKTGSGDISTSDLGADLSAMTGSGDVRAKQVTGNVTLATASGDVNAEEVNGALEANSASGDITARFGSGWTAFRTVSGSILVDGMTLKNAKIASVSGDITVKANFVNALAPYTIDTVSGDMTLDLAIPLETNAANLNFRSMSGSARVSAPWVSTSKRSWNIGNGGGIAISARSVSGDATLRTRLAGDISAIDEPLPNSDRYDDDQPTEPVRNGNMDIDFTFDRAEIDRAMSWAKDAARKFTQPLDPPTPPTPTPPATPPTPFTPPTPATPPAPPTPPAGAETLIHAQAEANVPVATTTPAPVTTTTPVPNTPEDTEALSVLEALERGEIDIDEAMARIERAETQTP